MKRGGPGSQGLRIRGAADINLPKVSVNIARAKRIHADVARRKLQRKIPGQGYQGSFGTRIYSRILEGMSGMNRTDIDDRSAA